MTVCYKCKIELTEDNQTPSARKRSLNKCKYCVRAYSREYSLKNKEVIKEYAKKHKALNPELCNARAREYNRRWRAKPENMQKMVEAVRRWRSKNPEKYKAYYQNFKNRDK